MWQHPYALIGSANITRVPILHGTNLDEGASFESLTKHVGAAEVQRDWQKWYGSTMGPDAATRLRDLYLTQSYPVSGVGSDSWWAAQRSLTDQSFVCSARALSHRLGAVTPVYQYVFRPATLPVRSHGSEVSYVFLHESLAPADRALAEQMADAWAAFAAEGMPGAGRWVRFDPEADGPYVTLDVSPSAGGHGIGTASGLYKATCGRFFDGWNEQVTRAA